MLSQSYLYVFMALLFEIKAEFVTNCTEQILNRYFENVTLALYYHSDLDVPDINFPTPKITFRDNQMLKLPLCHFRKFDSYVIVAKEEVLGRILNELHGMDEWNSRSLFLFVYDGDVDKLFQKLSEYFIYNIVAIDRNGSQIFTYYPYKYENFNAPDTKKSLLGSCTYKSLENYSTNFYPKKIPKTWRNSTVRVAYMNLKPFIICAKCGTGLEVQIVHLMCWYMKYRVEFSDVEYPDWGHIYPNGSYSGAIGDAQKGIADFVIGHFHLREEERLHDFDFTFSYLDDDVRWAVPRAGLRSHWYNMMHILNSRTWIAIFLSMAIAATFWYFVARTAPGEDDYNRSMVNSIEMAVVNILGLPVLHEPRTISMRVIFITVSIFCFITVNAWKAYLINSLTHETDAYQISTLKEITESTLILGIYPELRLLHKAEQTPEGDWVFQHADPNQCDASHKCLDRTAFQHDMCTIATIRMFRYLMPMRYRSPSGRDLLYVFKKTLVKDYTVQYYTKGHPTFPRANEFLIWVRTSGFVDNLDDRLNHELELTQAKYVASLSLFEIKVLGLRPMQGTFYCLIGGLAMSILVFLFELFYNRTQALPEKKFYYRN